MPWNVLQCRGLDSCPVMFSYLGEDHTSLKGSVVSISRFLGSACLWAVLLALAVLETSVSSAFSKWPSQHIFSPATQPPNSLWNLYQCFCFPFPPCTAAGSMLGRRLCGSFLSSLTVPSASQRLVWAREPFAGFLWPLSLPSASEGLCALVPAP